MQEVSRKALKGDFLKFLFFSLYCRERVSTDVLLMFSTFVRVRVEARGGSQGCQWANSRKLRGG